MVEWERMGSFIRRNLSLLGNVLRQANRDDCWGMSSEIAFVLMFVFFQGLILAVAVVSILGTNPDIFDSMVEFLGSFLPYDLFVVIRFQIAEISKADKAVILVLGMIGTLWTGSTLTLTLNKCFQRSYNVRETRTFWKLRGLSIVLAVAGLLLMAFVFSLLALGLHVARFVEASLGYRNAVALLLRVFRLPIAFVSTAGLASFLYYAMSNVDQDLPEVLPGALFFCLIWFFFTYLFGHYLKNIPEYNKTYGTLGALLIMMIWMYITALSLLLGSELNAELHRRKIRRVKAGRAEAPAPSLEREDAGVGTYDR
jgi:membrane protein